MVLPAPAPIQVNGTGPLTVNAGLAMPAALVAPSPSQSQVQQQQQALQNNSNTNQSYYQHQMLKSAHFIQQQQQQHSQQPQVPRQQPHQQNIYAMQHPNSNDTEQQRLFGNGLHQAPTFQSSPVYALNMKQQQAPVTNGFAFYGAQQQQHSPSQQQQQPLYQTRHVAPIYQQQVANGHITTSLRSKLAAADPNPLATLTRQGVGELIQAAEQRHQHQQNHQLPNNNNYQGQLQLHEQQAQDMTNVVYHLNNNNNHINNSHHHNNSTNLLQHEHLQQQQHVDLLWSTHTMNNRNNNTEQSIQSQHQSVQTMQHQLGAPSPSTALLPLELNPRQASVNFATNLMKQQHQEQSIASISQHNMTNQLIPINPNNPQQQLINHQDASIGRVPRSRPFSDRDSMSTLSRFDQLDDRRSFTMRSQCTNVNNAKRYADQVSFLKLTGEAFKRLLGFSSEPSSQINSMERRLLANESNKNLHRNLNLAMSVNNKSHQTQATNPFNGPNQMGPNASQIGTNYHYANKANPVTVIDSGEDYYFKKRVFKYQLNIQRLVSFLFGVFVLLSPIVMLLIPKMEFILNPGASTIDYNSLSSELLNNPSQDQVSSSSSGAGIKHSVGLSNNKQHQHNQRQGSHIVGNNNNNNNNLLHQQHQQHFAPQPQWRISDCTSDCDGPLIGFVIRMIMLCLAYWGLFFRQQTSSLPRIDFHRCLLVCMAICLTTAYWLFFIFRVFDKRFNDFELQYMTIVQFSISMLESLILLHYLALVLLEMRKRKKIYCLKVIRSPDGSSQYFSCGSLSIQECAQYVIEKYGRHFKQCGPYAKQLMDLEDELALNFSGSSSTNKQFTSNNHNDHHHSGGGLKTPPPNRSRAGSPAQSLKDNNMDSSTIDGVDRRRSQSRSSRHHSRSNNLHRSPSRSPQSRQQQQQNTGRSQRSQRKSLDISNNININTTNNKQNSSTNLDNHKLNLNKSKLEQEQQTNNNIIRSSTISGEQQENRTIQDAKINHLPKAATVPETTTTTNDLDTLDSNEKKHVSEKTDHDDNTNTNNNSNNHANNSNSGGDQSSDATSRMKESSLETIRAANSSSDLLANQKSVSTNGNQQQQHTKRDRDRMGSHRMSNIESDRQTTTNTGSHRNISHNNSYNDHHHHHHHHNHSHHNTRDEIESVRSVRSRRSTSRAHHSSRHHQHRDHSSMDHHERASSWNRNAASDHHHHQAAYHDESSESRDPIEEHERKLRRRKLRLLMSVQETFDQIKRIEEGKFNSVHFTLLHFISPQIISIQFILLYFQSFKIIWIWIRADASQAQQHL